MKRTYTLKRRAELQAATRQKIVEATVALHTQLGPARTTLSMIAERAGVQRHTLYAHFPDERSLAMACSGHALERDPPPAAQEWAHIADRRERLQTGLIALYAWYAGNADLLASVMRDAQFHDLTREVAVLRFGPAMERCHAVLGELLDADQQPLLALALSFHSWRTLAEAGLSVDAAATLMAEAVSPARAP